MPIFVLNHYRTVVLIHSCAIYWQIVMVLCSLLLLNHLIQNDLLSRAAGPRMPRER